MAVCRIIDGGELKVHNQPETLGSILKAAREKRVSPLKRWLKGLKSLSDTYIELKTKAKSQVSMFSIN